MNYGIIIKTLGYIMGIESILMIPSLFVSLYYKEESYMAFVISILFIGILGFALSRINVKNKKIKTKEGLAISTFAWIIISVLGSLPFILSGSIPSFVDALFETVSGFTTTGSTILNDIEALPRGILFWRSFIVWIGGMGILVFTLAIMPTLGVSGFQMFKAEAPGPVKDRIVPKIKETSKILYEIYLIFTVLQLIFLLLGGLSFYDALIHTFTIVSTGGFSGFNSSIGAYESSYVHTVISIFMILCGVNFSLYFSLYKRKWKDVLRNEELRFYLGIIVAAVILITINLLGSGYTKLGIALRDAFFQTSSLVTTTGFSTTNFDLWPAFSKAILFLLMFLGGSAGSTTGGIKISRMILLIKLVKRQIVKIFHPRAIVPIKFNGKSISSDTTASVTSFFVLYLGIFMGATILISLEGINLESAFTSILATLGNVGIGYGEVGPTRNFEQFSDLSTLLFSFLMLLGRLELFTVIALFVPDRYKNEV